MNDDDERVAAAPQRSSDDDLARAAVEGTQALVLIFDERGHCLSANPAVTRALGWTREELGARPFWDVYVAPEHVILARQAFTLAIERGLAFPQEGDWLDRSGARRRIRMHNDVLRDEGGQPYALVTVGMDVTQQNHREALLRERAEIDHLTGLSNRSAFFDHLSTALHARQGAGVGLLFCDLDGFKQVNDEHGHHVGDLLLTQVAQRLQDSCAPDHVAARFGGDEFVILFPHADEQRLSLLAERIKIAMRDPIVTSSGTINIGVSVGWAISEPKMAADELIQAADHRMYRVKSVRQRHASILDSDT
ncbi:sensor domain-containing diguanylate cyclase [Kineococcus rubinsiae]|uniref:sensor domain-containing diguanylate cyclase n=1 Tax=Kineococcus rubinsiae TaxID=2609562 RepID=UPI001431097C|nr:diguanylate cyclase [Kineococcus rubinsiae]